MSAPEVFFDGKVTLHAGDCLDVLDTLDDNSIDGCVTDPPYHFESIHKRFGKEGSAPAQGRIYQGALAGFTGEQWEGGGLAFDPETWRKVLRVLKPGAHLVASTASTKVGPLQNALTLAGFETRDTILNMIDADERVIEFMETLSDAQRVAFLKCAETSDIGGLLAWVYGTGFPKGKPLAKFMDRHYLGDYLDDDEIKRGAVSHSAAFYEERDVALKPAFEPILLVRKPLDGTFAENLAKWGTGSLSIDACRVLENGNYPSNVVLDGSARVAGAFPSADDESAARFFYSAKAGADDRVGSKHPTVKPVNLPQYLTRLITSPGQTVLDPFAGTGTTGEAAFREGRRAVLIELGDKWRADIRRRMALCLAGPEERKRESIKAKVGDVPFEAGSLFGSLNA